MELLFGVLSGQHSLSFVGDWGTYFVFLFYPFLPLRVQVQALSLFGSFRDQSVCVVDYLPSMADGV